MINLKVQVVNALSINSNRIIYYSLLISKSNKCSFKSLYAFHVIQFPIQQLNNVAAHFSTLLYCMFLY